GPARPIMHKAQTAAGPHHAFKRLLAPTRPYWDSSNMGCERLPVVAEHLPHRLAIASCTHHCRMRHTVLRVVPEVLLGMCTDALYKIHLGIDYLSNSQRI
ncbi:hypothetical protein, partial [Acidovorax sp. SUPP3334]|uniref:hypothetical protein n=1 Tax=Acidovorax sp. SUPP3334 TaxID=2920881 RepID=UPI0024E066DD